MSVQGMDSGASITIKISGFSGANGAHATTGRSADRPQTNSEMLDLLVKSMKKDDGSINSNNPIAKLLSQFVANQTGRCPENALKGASDDDLERMLLAMIGEKTGGGSHDYGVRGSRSSGSNDMLARLIGALTQSILENVLQPAGDGATFSDEDKGMLNTVAQFMDRYPDIFGKPDDATGSVRSWADEINEDNYFNAEEATSFKNALGLLGQTASSGNAEASGTLAGTDLSINPDGGGHSGCGGQGGFGGFVGNPLHGGQGGSIKITLSANQFMQLMQGQQQGGAGYGMNGGSGFHFSGGLSVRPNLPEPGFGSGFGSSFGSLFGSFSQGASLTVSYGGADDGHSAESLAFNHDLSITAGDIIDRLFG